MENYQHDVQRYVMLLPTLARPRTQNPALFGDAWIPAVTITRNLLLFHTHPPVCVLPLGGRETTQTHTSLA
eukprot:10149907-Ditylum_brightwellii.AAC.1